MVSLKTDCTLSLSSGYHSRSIQDSGDVLCPLSSRPNPDPSPAPTQTLDLTQGWKAHPHQPGLSHYSPGLSTSKPNQPNPGLSQNIPASLFLNMYQNAWITLMKTRRTLLVFLCLIMLVAESEIEMKNFTNHGFAWSGFEKPGPGVSCDKKYLQ